MDASEYIHHIIDMEKNFSQIQMGLTYLKYIIIRSTNYKCQNH